MQAGFGVLFVAEPPGVYRPRRPEKTVFYRLLEGQFDRYVQAHEERFAPRAGPLRRVVPEAVAEYLDCGRLANGFARLRCTSCGGEHLLAFSCRTRNLCPSCQAKRAALFGERLRQEIALPVPHRHVTFTIPRALRGLFERDRSLLGLLARCAHEALRRLYQARVGRKDAVPGVVASIQTFGSYLNFHPHVHALVTEGVVAPDGTFVPVAAPDLEAVCELYRRLVLSGLRRRERLSAEFHERLLAWSPSGFSVHGEQVARADEPERLERLARYVTRAPFAVDRVLAGGDAEDGADGVGGARGDEVRRPAGERTVVRDDGDGEADGGLDDCGLDVKIADPDEDLGADRTRGDRSVSGRASGRGGATSRPSGRQRPGPARDVPRVRVLTPPDPATGRTVLEMDVLEFIHRVTTQIPDPRRHLVRYYGAYASRTRGARRARQAAAGAATAATAAAGAATSAAAKVASQPSQSTAAAQAAPPSEPAPPASPSRANWARLLRRIFEVDPLLCPRCGGGLAVVAVLTDPKVVDRILRHLSERGLATSVHARAPPGDPADPSAA